MTVPAFACVSLNRLRQFFFGDVLNIFVERQHDARAGVRRLVAASRTSGGARRPGSASCPACCECCRRASTRFRPALSRRCPRSRARARRVRASDKSVRLPAGNKFRADSSRRCAPLFPEEVCAQSTRRNASWRAAWRSRRRERPALARAGAPPCRDRQFPKARRKHESTGTLMASGFMLRSKISARLGADVDDQPLLVLRAGNNIRCSGKVAGRPAARTPPRSTAPRGQLQSIIRVRGLRRSIFSPGAPGDRLQSVACSRSSSQAKLSQADARTPHVRIYCCAAGAFAGRASATTAFGGRSIGATCPGTGAVKPKLPPRNHVDAFRRAQARHFQFQFLIEFGGLRALAAQRFELVAQLDRLEMLPGIQKGAQGDQSAQRNQARAFAQVVGRHEAHQARIINLFHGVRTRSLQPLFLLRHPVAGRDRSFRLRASSRCAPADSPRSPRPKLESLSWSESSARPLREPLKALLDQAVFQRVIAEHHPPASWR